MKNRLLVVLVLLMSAVLMLPVQAQTADTPVVYAVLLYSPSCPHCHELIQNGLPPIIEEFGDSLEIIIVNVQTEGGNQLSRAIYERYNVPQDRWVVPMMIVDNRVLIGGIQIPTELRVIVRDGLARGGIGLPDVPGLAEAYNAMMVQQAAVEAADNPETAPTELALELSLMERLAADPIANAIAVIVLVGLIFSLLVLTVPQLKAKFTSAPLTLNVLRVLTVATMGIALSLVLQTKGDALATLTSWGVLSLMATALVILLVEPKYRKWAVPLTIISGLLAAIYLAYIEVAQAEATCGFVGNCNAVQQSDYAVLFGLLPVGVLGVIGYIAIFIAWVIAQRLDLPIAHGALAVMTLGGVLFSAYLTFLEPFVIGATCAWCLTSALTMLVLAWSLAPKGLDVIFGQADRSASLQTAAKSA